jgi:D,D-heptose 1,7-bisphosphate phosphatase
VPVPAHGHRGPGRPGRGGLNDPVAVEAPSRLRYAAAVTSAPVELPQAAPLQAVVLVGGLGTRLGALTGGLPKPLVEVGGRPFLSYLLWHLRRFGFERVLLLAGHRAEHVRAQVAALAPEGLAVEVVVEPEPLGTGGALRHAAPRLDARFLLLNGDSLFDFNWLDLVTLWDEGADAALSLRREADASRFGVVRLEGARVTGFAERGDAEGGLINGGVYLLSRAAAEACPAKGSFERETLPALAAAGRVRGREQQGFFLDIGVPDALARAQELVPQSLSRPAVFFDRDGVLNVDAGYTHRVADLRWVEGAVKAVKAVNDAGRFAFLVTNQAGVARGLYGEADVRALHAHMQVELRRRGAHLDDVRYCPHHPDGSVEGYARACDWRKPAPGMLLDLMRAWPVRREASLLVGDKPSDLEAAAAAGVAGLAFAGGRLDQALSGRL